MADGGKLWRPAMPTWNLKPGIKRETIYFWLIVYQPNADLLLVCLHIVGPINRWFDTDTSPFGD